MTEAIHKKRNGLSPWSVHLLDLIQSARCKIIVALAEIGYENGHAGCVMAWQSARGGLGLPCAKGRLDTATGLPKRKSPGEALLDCVPGLSATAGARETVAGRTDRELGRRCLWSGLAPPRGIGQTMKREFWPDPNANLLRMPHTFLHGSKLSDVHSGDGPENDQIVRGARSPRS